MGILFVFSVTSVPVSEYFSTILYFDFQSFSVLPMETAMSDYW